MMHNIVPITEIRTGESPRTPFFVVTLSYNAHNCKVWKVSNN